MPLPRVVTVTEPLHLQSTVMVQLLLLSQSRNDCSPEHIPLKFWLTTTSTAVIAITCAHAAGPMFATDVARTIAVEGGQKQVRLR